MAVWPPIYFEKTVAPPDLRARLLAITGSTNKKPKKSTSGLHPHLPPSQNECIPRGPFSSLGQKKKKKRKLWTLQAVWCKHNGLVGPLFLIFWGHTTFSPRWPFFSSLFFSNTTPNKRPEVRFHSSEKVSEKNWPKKFCGRLMASAWRLRAPLL